MAFKTLDDMDLAGKIVLTRVDINVPIDGDRVTDTTRIDRIVPQVTDILAAGGTPVLLAHFGRPKGKVVPEMSLSRVVPALEAALGRSVTFIERPDRAALEAASGPCCSRTPASRPWRKPTTQRWRNSWPRRGRLLQRCPSRPPTAPMPRPRAWPACCPPAPGG